jgi:hypothetical protein
LCSQVRWEGRGDPLGMKPVGNEEPPQ